MNKLTQVTFWLLVAVFIVVITIFFIARELLVCSPFLIASGIALLLLGATLIYFTLKEKVRRPLKWFLLISGASAAGIPISAVLHNVIYGLFIQFFGANFWDKVGLSDEPVFFAYNENTAYLLAEIPDQESIAEVVWAFQAGGGPSSIKATPMMTFTEAMGVFEKASRLGYSPPIERS